MGTFESAVLRSVQGKEALGRETAQRDQRRIQLEAEEGVTAGFRPIEPVANDLKFGDTKPPENSGTVFHGLDSAALPEVTEVHPDMFMAALQEQQRESWERPSVRARNPVASSSVDAFAPAEPQVAKADRLMANDAQELRAAKDMLRDFLRQEKELVQLSGEIEKKLDELDAERRALESTVGLNTESGIRVLEHIAGAQGRKEFIENQLRSKRALIDRSKAAFQKKFDMSFDQITGNN